jgi:hypothetical protein
MHCIRSRSWPPHTEPSPWRRRDAEEGAELARVPLSLCVTEVPGRNLLQPDAPRDLPWSAFMAASLMHRSSEDKYLLSLPQSSPCLTDSHSHDELKELQFLDAYYVRCLHFR